MYRFILIASLVAPMLPGTAHAWCHSQSLEMCRDAAAEQYNTDIETCMRVETTTEAVYGCETNAGWAYVGALEWCLNEYCPDELPAPVTPANPMSEDLRLAGDDVLTDPLDGPVVPEGEFGTWDEYSPDGWCGNEEVYPFGFGFDSIGQDDPGQPRCGNETAAPDETSVLVQATLDYLEHVVNRAIVENYEAYEPNAWLETAPLDVYEAGPYQTDLTFELEAFDLGTGW